MKSLLGRAVLALVMTVATAGTASAALLRVSTNNFGGPGNNFGIQNLSGQSIKNITIDLSGAAPPIVWDTSANAPGLGGHKPFAITATGGGSVVGTNFAAASLAANGFTLASLDFSSFDAGASALFEGDADQLASLSVNPVGITFTATFFDDSTVTATVQAQTTTILGEAFAFGGTAIGGGAIPEPTSGLLVSALLGCAIGFRRRRS